MRDFIQNDTNIQDGNYFDDDEYDKGYNDAIKRKRLTSYNFYRDGWREAIGKIYNKLQEVGFPETPKEEEGFYEWLQELKEEK